MVDPSVDQNGPGSLDPGSRVPRLRLDFGGRPTRPPPAVADRKRRRPATDPPPSPPGTLQQVAQFLGLDGSAFDLIAPLFTISLIPGQFDAVTGGGGFTLLADFLPGQGKSTPSDEDEADGETTEEAETPEEEDPDGADEEAPELPLWARVAMGIDQAWEEVRAELLAKDGVTDVVSNRPAPVPSRAKFLSSFPKRASMPRPAKPEAGTKALVSPSVPSAGDESKPSGTTSPRAVDATIEALATDPIAESDLTQMASALLAEIKTIETDRLPRSIVIVAVASTVALAWRNKKARRRRLETPTFRHT
jgi:hypothetical protein